MSQGKSRNAFAISINEYCGSWACTGVFVSNTPPAGLAVAFNGKRAQQILKEESMNTKMSSEEALSFFYRDDAWNSLGHPRVINLPDGREAITWCEGGVWSPDDHGYAIYIKGVDY